MWSLLEKAYTVLALFYLTGGLLHFLWNNDSGVADPREGNPKAFAIEALIYLLCFVFIVPGWRSFVSAAWRLKWILALVLLAFMSTSWSEAPTLTLRRSLVLAGTTAFGIYFGVRYRQAQQVRLLSYTLSLVIIISLGLAIMLPAYGIAHDAHDGAWVGIFSTKNALGRAMVLAILVFWLAPFRRPAGYLVRIVGVTLGLMLLLRSESVTGMLVQVVLLALMPLYAIVRQRVSISIPILAAVALALVLAIGLSLQDAATSTRVFGRDATLTGRTLLWGAALVAIQKRPFLGYGFNAFWLGFRGESGSIMSVVRWDAPHAHNGYLDLCLDVGLIGLVVFAFGLVIGCARAFRHARRSRQLHDLWPLLYLSFMLLYNLTESAILRLNSIYWALYVAVLVSVSVIRVRHASEPATLVPVLSAESKCAS